jgi:hypothetical protein
MLRNRTFVSAFAVALVLMASDASALDGNRKGFVIGFGVGPAATTFRQGIDVLGRSHTSDTEQKIGIATDFKIGVGASDRLLLYYTAHVSWFKHGDVFTYDNPDTDVKEALWVLDGFNAVDRDSLGNVWDATREVWIASGFSGFGLTYYFNPGPTSLYVIGAAGISIWSTTFEDDDMLAPFVSHTRNWYGPGALLGMGYEFHRHWSFQATASWGNPGETGNAGLDVSTDTVSLSVILTWLAY